MPGKIYLVLRGREPGVYGDWACAEPQIRGVPHAIHQSFSKGEEDLAKKIYYHFYPLDAPPHQLVNDTGSAANTNAVRKEIARIAKGLLTEPPSSLLTPRATRTFDFETPPFGTPSTTQYGSNFNRPYPQPRYSVPQTSSPSGSPRKDRSSSRSTTISGITAPQTPGFSPKNTHSAFSVSQASGYSPSPPSSSITPSELDLNSLLEEVTALDSDTPSEMRSIKILRHRRDLGKVIGTVTELDPPEMYTVRYRVSTGLGEAAEEYLRCHGYEEKSALRLGQLYAEAVKQYPKHPYTVFERWVSMEGMASEEIKYLWGLVE